MIEPDRDDSWFWSAVFYTLIAMLLLITLAGCSSAPAPICQALVTQVEQADSHERLEHADRLYRRHCR